MARAKSPPHFVNLSMADVYSRKKRSDVMSRIKATDTKPELIVRKYIFSRGLRFRIHQKNLPGKPDIVLKKYHSIVLVNGCFWHGHKNCKVFKMPKSNKTYWVPKINRNIVKQKETISTLRRLGWKVFIIWECELKKSKQNAALTKLLRKIMVN